MKSNAHNQDEINAVEVALEKLFETLDVWYGSLTFDQLNEIHNVDLFEVEDIHIDTALNTLRDEWNDMDLDDKLDCYDNFLI